jgi:predicted nucleic acid-binding Zn ribbon protein
MDTSDKNTKAKTVGTLDMNINQHPPKVERRDWLDESIDDHLHCVLCGTKLVFSHKTDFVGQKVAEKAHCPSCGVKIRECAYDLQ